MANSAIAKAILDAQHAVYDDMMAILDREIDIEDDLRETFESYKATMVLPASKTKAAKVTPPVSESEITPASESETHAILEAKHAVYDDMMAILDKEIDIDDDLMETFEAYKATMTPPAVKTKSAKAAKVTPPVSESEIIPASESETHASDEDA